MRTVLFLCTGNYYRSRFAEEIFNARAAALGLDWRAESRALAIERGKNNVGPISPLVRSALADSASYLRARIGYPFQALGLISSPPI